MKKMIDIEREIIDIGRFLRELNDTTLKKQYPESHACGCKIYKERLEKLENILKELENGKDEHLSETN